MNTIESIKFDNIPIAQSLYYYLKIAHLDTVIKNNDTNIDVVSWASYLKSLCDKAMQDILIGFSSYAELTQTTPLIYFMLANRTKDGFELANLFYHKDGTCKTLKECHDSFPLFQMTRLMQVRAIINITE